MPSNVPIPDHWPDFKTETPASYCITVQGGIDPSRSDLLGGLSIRPHRYEDGSIVTKLTGKVADQAALTGILNSLYNMQLPVLSVECLEVHDP